MPRQMRYQPKGLKSCLRTKPVSQLMAARDTTKATTRPTPMMAHSSATMVLPASTNFTILSRLAPNMTGIARKNVKRVATERDVPRSRPPMMVEPEREVPGTSESTWKQPMPSAVFHDRSSTSVMRPKSASACGAAGVAKCAPSEVVARSAASERFLARQFSMRMKATPYRMSIAATT